MMIVFAEKLREISAKFLPFFTVSEAQFEGDLGGILALGAEISPYILVSGRSGSLTKKKKKKNFFFF